MQHYESLNRLKDLFRELFQLDTADLDFGLYRLFRLKRAEIETFLDKQLPAEVDQAFETVAGEEQIRLQKRTEELAKQARDIVIDDDPILPNGDPNPKYAMIKPVQEYTQILKRLKQVQATEAQRAEVFNHLYAFFSRYYDEGDFIPRRFFGARSTYAVPYNGEEVLFHWANRDQYYVKSGEAFRDYAFMLNTLHGEYRVRFKLVEATTSKDNTKGDTRFFFPRPTETVFDKTAGILTIPFEYRLPTEPEAARYGAKGKAQEGILDAFEEKILDSVSDSMLKSCLAEPSPTGREKEGESPLSLLRRRLTHFTKKNTTDFFVHKNLGAFLRQELEFFIRDQIVHEADLEGDFDNKRRMLRVFRKLTDTVITFLAQVEDAQKRLFEKKKFILRTDYLVPIQNVPRNLWKEVLANKAQLEEWKQLHSFEPRSDLFNLKGKINEYALGLHPTLVVDTRHFSPDFAARLLANIEDLDESTDGVLVYGENFQALLLMQARHKEDIDTIYIDPPYNTDASPIAYKNGYRHASWLALVGNGVALTRSAMTDGAIMCVTIDDVEVHNLRMLLEGVLPEHELLGTVAIKNNPAGRTGTVGFSTCHEYALFYGRRGTARVGRLQHSQAQKDRYKERDNIGAFEWTNFRKHGGLNTYRTARPRQFYPIYIHGDSIRIPKMEWDNASRTWKIIEEARPAEEVLLPIDEAGRERIWDFVVDTAREQLPHLIIRKDSRGTAAVYRKWRLHSQGLLPQTIWDKSEYSAAEYGTNLLANIFGETHKFTFPKSVHAVVDCLRVANLRTTVDGSALDFFAGSGTTGHAVINLNREDGGQRKFILVEMADYFDTVLVPRIKKVMFTPEWKEGKPKRLATNEEAERTPRLVKVLRLESYEDALHNTFSDSNIERLSGREKAYRQVMGDEEYRIRYLVKLPLEASDSMLSLAKLEHPFDYTIETLSDYGPRAQTVDLVETFNWLYGLRVKRVLTWINKADKVGKEKEGRLYRAASGTDRESKKRVLVVWRDMTGLDPVKDREFLEDKSKEIGPFEEQWVNGDSAATGFASLDALFKRLMAGGET